MRKSILAASAAALAFVSTAALAAVTLNYDGDGNFNGTGFVGKGDVQLALGMNNAQVQKASLAFTYDSVDTYDVTCDWTTVTGGPNSQTIYHDVTIPKHTSVNSTVSYDARVRTQITGYNLIGFGSYTTEGTVPVVGGSCPGNNPGTISDVTLTGSTGGLSVNGIPLIY